jgi:hypothetical protein
MPNLSKVIVGWRDAAAGHEIIVTARIDQFVEMELYVNSI